MQEYFLDVKKNLLEFVPNHGERDRGGLPVNHKPQTYSSKEEVVSPPLDSIIMNYFNLTYPNA